MRKIRNILFLLGIAVLLSSCTNSKNEKYRGEEDNSDYKIEVPQELYSTGKKEYKVNHYFENDNGEYIEQPQYKETLVGNIGDKTNAKPMDAEGFRVKAFEQKDITDDTDVTIDIYYELISYTISLTSDSEAAGIAGSGTYNRYNDTAYLVARPYIGYEFKGWYLGDDLISPNEDYSFKVDKDLDITAKFKMKDEFIPFEFYSNLDECYIDGLLDTSINDLVIPEGVTEIDQYAFTDKRNIEKVTFPKTLKKIASFAFYDCTNIFSIVINSEVTLVNNCFYNCHKLLEVYDLGNNNITLPATNTSYGRLGMYSKVVHTSIDEESIYDIDQDGFVFTKLDNINYLVGYKGSSNEIVLPTKNENYKIYQYAFYDKDFSVLTIPSCVSEIGEYSFRSEDSSSGIKHLYEIYNLSSLSLSKGSTSHGYVAKNAQIIHTSLDEEKCIFTIGDFIYKKEKESNIDYARIVAYVGDTQVNTITIPTINDYKIIIDKNLFSVDVNSNFRNLNEVILNNNVVTIEEKAFYNCNNLKTINLENVEVINKEAFRGCSSLEEVNLAKCKTLSTNAFYTCSSLKKATITECETIGDGAFYNCYALEDVSFPKAKKIDSYAFYNCYSLIQVTLPSTLTTINTYAFYQCYRLVEVINHSSKTISKSTSNGYVGNYALNIVTSESNSNIHTNNNLITYESGSDVILMDVIGCGDELVIPTNVTEIARLAFYNLEHITSLSIPVLGNVLAYYFGVPNYYGSYDSLDLPNKLTKVYLTGNIETIPEKAFYGRKSIKEINIPVSVKAIGPMAFTDVYLDNLYYDGYINDWTNVQFSDSESNPMIYSNNSYLRDDDGDITYGNKKYSSITSVALSEGITSIGAYQFAGLPFESFSIPSTVTSIGEGAFSECKNLKSISIPNGVTYIADSLFSGCVKLNTVVIPSSVTEIGEYAFYNTGLNDITLSNNITLVGYYAFSECKSLIKATIPNIEIQSGLFQNCINLQKVNLDSNIEVIGANAFNGCKSLSNITIPSSLTTVGYQAFASTNLKSFVAPSSLTNLGAMAFYKCLNLKEVDLGDTTITSIPDYYGSSIISGCRKIEIVILPDTINSLGYIVYDLPKLEYINGLYFGTKSNPYYYFYMLDSNSITEFDAFHPDCKYIWDGAFSGYNNLKSVTIPNTIEYYSSIFNYSNDSLESITLPRIPFCLGDLFGGYGYGYSVNSSVPTSLKTITLTSNYRIRYEAFRDCTNIENVILSNDITEIGYKAFMGCNSLRNINIPTSLTMIDDNTFEDCVHLHQITIPENITVIGDDAFYNCSGLYEVRNLSNLSFEIGSDDYGYVACYAKVIIGKDDPSSIFADDNGYVFMSLDNSGNKKVYLIDYVGDSTELVLPDSVTINNEIITEYEINDDAFYNCNSLMSVKISDSVKRIGNYAFYYCTSLEYVEIGSGVEETLGDSLFYGCNALTTINYSGSISDFELIRPSSDSWYDYSGITKVSCQDGIIDLG